MLTGGANDLVGTNISVETANDLVATNTKKIHIVLCCAHRRCGPSLAGEEKTAEGGEAVGRGRGGGSGGRGVRAAGRGVAGGEVGGMDYSPLHRIILKKKILYFLFIYAYNNIHHYIGLSLTTLYSNFFHFKSSNGSFDQV